MEANKEELIEHYETMVRFCEDAINDPEREGSGFYWQYLRKKYNIILYLLYQERPCWPKIIAATNNIHIGIFR